MLYESLRAPDRLCACVAVIVMHASRSSSLRRSVAANFYNNNSELLGDATLTANCFSEHESDRSVMCNITPVRALRDQPCNIERAIRDIGAGRLAIPDGSAYV